MGHDCVTLIEISTGSYHQRVGNFNCILLDDMKAVVSHSGNALGHHSAYGVVYGKLTTIYTPFVERLPDVFGGVQILEDVGHPRGTT